MGAVENIYGLTPLQQGMLFHSLADPSSGVYVEQLCCTLRGELDQTAFEEAWQLVVDRHPVLRTSIVWDRPDRPLQVVRRGARVSWHREDWREAPGADPRVRLDSYLVSDRRRGIALDAAPLMRLALIRLPDDEIELVWTFHHMMLDGWSTSIVLEEVCGLYMAARRGERMTLPAARPFGEYVGWLDRRDRPSDEAFWRRALAGVRTPTRLPVEGMGGKLLSPDAGGIDGVLPGEQRVELPAGVTAALQDLARRHQLTLHTLVLGAGAILLGRITGERDVIVGTTVSGRPPELPGVGQMVGLFINTVPARLRVGSRERVLPWLREVQRDQVERLQHGHTPLVDVQTWTGVPGGTTLFDTLVVFENFPVDETLGEGLRGIGLEVRRVRSLERTTDPLTIVATPGPRLSLRALYDGSRFDAPLIGGMLEGLGSLLERIVAAPETRLGDLDLLPGSQAPLVLRRWAETAASYPRDRSIPDLFAERARKEPDRIALEFGSERITYSQLDERADSLARRLEARGVGPEVRVGVCAQRSIEMIVAMLGILKAGGVMLPMDPSYPEDRLALMLADSGALLILTQSRLRSTVPGFDGETFLLDAEAGPAPVDPGPAGARRAVERPRPSAETLAYIIYTSGSTGRPKGVAVAHRSVVRLVKGASFARLDPDQTFLQLAPISFDASVFEIWGALLNGARLVVAPPGTLTIEEIERVIQDHGVTTLWLTAPLFHQIADGHLAALRGVRQLLAGGDVLPVPAVRRTLDELEDCRLINGYGPTEGTTFTCCHEILETPGDSGPIPIGKPISGTRVFVLDGELHPVPVGVPGELFIGGDGLARGYWNDPELTAERFVPDPLGVEPGARLYRTGDRVRWLPSGVVEFLGRIDRQLKIRGYRVEPAEIEARLLEHPALKEAVVVPGEDPSGGRRLVAYVVPRGGDAPSSAELQVFLGRTLPAPMVPSLFISLDSLPRSPSGKIDRSALPAPATGSSTHGPRTLSRTPIEEMLAGIWADVLGIPGDIGPEADFFELGGHSLIATQIASRIRQSFRVEIPLRLLFEAPTLGSFASRLEARMRSADAHVEPAIVAVARDGALPLSFAQERLWFLDQLEPDSSLYNLPTFLRIEGPLEVACLEKSLRGIADRHETLRTSFEVIEGRPVSVIALRSNLELPLLDLSSCPPGERDDRVRSLAAQEAERPFDLSRGPLLRALLLRVGERDHVLLLTLHHIVSDGWSQAVFARELAVLYEAFVRGSPSPLPALEIQYVDYASWQRGGLAGVALEEQLTYWKQRLAGLPPPADLPADRPRPPVQSFRGAQSTFLLERDLTRRLKELSRREGATLFMTLLAAFQTLLHRYTGQQDIVVGTPVANRHRSETEGLIGFFVNTLVLRGDLSGDPPFREWLGRVRRGALEAYAHQDLPFEKLVETLRVPRDLSRSPIFQVMFDLQNVPVPALELTGLTIRALHPETVTSKFDVNVSLTEVEEGLAGTVEYSTDLFEAATIERMVGHFERLLSGIVENPDLRLSDLDPLTETERAKILRGWNDTRVEWPDDGGLHDLIEAQVRRSPERIAVECEGEEQSYRELDGRADRIAGRLRALGVRPDVPVGVCLERSLDLVAALLAVLKAGGAYLPLDPDYPAERLGLLLRNTAAPVVVTGGSLARKLPPGSYETLRLDEPWVATARDDTAAPSSRARPANLIYVLHTSGSTGEPKGVMVPHEGIVNRLRWMQKVYPLTAGDRVLHKTPFTFDVSVWELFWPLIAGARLVVARPGGHRDTAYLAGLIADRGITTAHFVPSMLEVFLEEAALPRKSSLERVICSGEALRPDLEERFFARFDAELHNLYGPTEASIDVTAHRCEPGEGRVPIGRPISNTRIHILDSRHHLVPVGVPGQIFIGGIGLARGYLGRPDLTAERFVPDPFAETGERLYATGDRARYLPDGSIEYLGRADSQVKIRGFRVEPGEIEPALAAHPGVRECAVVAYDGAGGDKRLVGYFVSREIPAPPPGELRRFLLERLPEYMVPSSFVQIETLPLGATGKLDRKSLPSPAAGAVGDPSRFLPPRTPVEEAFARIWRELLGLPSVGAADNFFELGGHSLLATQALHRARDLFGVELSLRTFFESPTISDLAAATISREPQPGRSEKIARLANAVEAMSDDEVRMALRERSGESGPA